MLAFKKKNGVQVKCSVSPSSPNTALTVVKKKENNTTITISICSFFGIIIFKFISKYILLFGHMRGLILKFQDKKCGLTNIFLFPNHGNSIRIQYFFINNIFFIFLYIFVLIQFRYNIFINKSN